MDDGSDGIQHARAFRVQPWPTLNEWDHVRNTEVCDRKTDELEALPVFGNDPDALTRGHVEVPTEDGDSQILSGYHRYDDPMFHLHRRVMETRLGFDLFADVSWRNHVRTFAFDEDERDEGGEGDEGNGGANLEGEEADGLFYDLRDEMDSGDWVRFMGQPFLDLRLLVEWALKHRVDGISALLDADMLHVGSHLFPRMRTGWNPRPVRSRSLMAIAAYDVCSPAAVDLLLSRGADPDACMCEEGAAPTFGPPALAWQDVAGEWEGEREDKAAIIRSLCRGGACVGAPHVMYGQTADPEMPRSGWEEEHAMCWALYQAQAAQRVRDTRIKVGNLIALVGIVSFWRRVAAAPGSRAAKRARVRFEEAARGGA